MTHDEWILRLKDKWVEARADGRVLTMEDLLAGESCPFAADPDFRARLDAECRSWTEAFASHAAAEPAGERPDARTAEIELPARIGEYEILGILGHGGMGIVFKARHVNLKRIVALKMIAPASKTDKLFVARIKAEAEAIARLTHPNIVQIYEIGEHLGQPYLALEYVDGGSLEQVLTHGPLSPHKAAEIIETLAHAMHAAHSHDIVHRDLKPSNVLLNLPNANIKNALIDKDTKNERHLDPRALKIADFGLAKRLDADTAVSKPDSVLGTPTFMAPEQALALPVTSSADVYALGALLYACVTGRPPHQGATVLETLDMVRSRDPVPPAELQPNIPRDLETICLKCLAKSPRDRYATAQALAHDLRSFLDGRPISARRPTSIRRFAMWCKREPAWAAILGLSVILPLVAAAIFFITARNESNLRNLAQQNEKKADESFRDAREAVDFYSDVAEDELIGKPGMQELRKKLQKKSLEYYERFINQRKNDASIQPDLAKAYYRQGRIHRESGDPKKAMTLLRLALEIQETLMGQSPSDAIDADRAMTHIAMGAAHFDLDEFDAARESFDNSREILERLQTAPLPPTDVRYHLARVYTNIGAVYGELDKFDEAIRWHNKSRALAERLVAETDKKPLVAKYTSHLALTWNNIGVVENVAYRSKEALHAYTEASKLHEKLVAQYPFDHRYRFRLATDFFDMALLYGTEGDATAAMKSHAAASTLLERLVAEDPSLSDYQIILAKIDISILLLQGINLSEEEAKKRFDRAKTIVSGDNRDSPTYREQLAKCLVGYGWRQANPEKALEFVLRGHEIYKKLNMENPTNVTYHCEVGWTSRHIAIQLEKKGDVTKAREAFVQAIDSQRVAFTRNPTVPRHRIQLSISYAGLARLDRSNDRGKDAVEAILKRAELWADDGGELYKVAVDLAQCLPILQMKSDREACVTKTLGFLEQAVAKGFGDREALKNESAFSPLRKLDEFRKLETELERKIKSSKSQ